MGTFGVERSAVSCPSRHRHDRRRTHMNTRATCARDEFSIELTNVCLSFGRKRALRHVSFRVRAGAVLAVLGRNGAGKSTLLNVILGLERHDSGMVSVLGTLPDDPRARRRVGCQFQQTSLHPLMTAGEAVRLFASYQRATRSIRDSLIDELGLRSAENTLFKHLSGGERQRLAVAIALLGRPDVVLLDEPSSALDVHGRHVLWRLLQRLRDEGCTIIMTTQSIPEAETLADQVLVLHHGEVQGCGTIVELVKRFSGNERVDFALSGDADAVTHVVAELRARFVVSDTGRMFSLSGAHPRLLLEALWVLASQHRADLVEARLQRGSLEEAFEHLTDGPQHQ
jgi:ABC-2 type transport system ATP-binding protein